MSITGLLPPDLTKGVQPYTDDIVAGPVHPLSATGISLAVGNVTNGTDIWTGTATRIPIPPNAGQQMTLVSTSANDTNGGTGVNKVEIQYLDASGNEKTEDVTLNGVGSVNTVATNIRFINDLHTLVVGTNTAAIGTITIFALGSPATVYSQIDPGFNRHRNTARMVPSGLICMIEDFNASGGRSGGTGATSGFVQLRITAHHGLLLPVNPNPVFNLEDTIGIFNTSGSHKFNTPIIAPAFAIIKCSAFNVANTPDIQASWFGKLITAPV